MILAELVRKWRVSHEISRRSCATMIGLNHCTLKRFEDGEMISGTHLAAILAWALGDQPFSHAALATRALDGPQDTDEAERKTHYHFACGCCIATMAWLPGEKWADRTSICSSHGTTSFEGPLSRSECPICRPRQDVSALHGEET